MQNLTGTDRRKLVYITEKKELRGVLDSTQQHCHSVNIYHGQLIYNDIIISERIVLIQRQQR